MHNTIHDANLTATAFRTNSLASERCLQGFFFRDNAQRDREQETLCCVQVVLALILLDILTGGPDEFLVCEEDKCMC